MHDKYKKAHRTPLADDRLRRQIAQEAARRLVATRDETNSTWLETLTEPELYTAKRKAAAVLGRRVRPGDLPSDSEVRIEAIALIQTGDPIVLAEEPEPEGLTVRMADHLDRFTVYQLKLAPLEAVKQNPKTHPEGDALYHSLQVFEIARDARPYDEEFLLAALLHDVGKAIEPGDHINAAIEALRGSITDRTLGLIEHHHDLDENPRARLPTQSAEFLSDLQLLHECDLAGRIAGRPVEGLESALAYLRGLEHEAYLTE